MYSFEAFRPSPHLQIDINDTAFVEHVDAVNEHLSRKGAQHFIDAAEQAQNHRGIEYALVGAEDDRSVNSAILMPGTFANGVWPHLVARAEALSFQVANAGLRDQDGMLMPVLLTASPSMNSRFGLDKSELSLIRQGNFEPVAQRHIDLVRFSGLELIYGITGTSQASVLAAPFAVRAAGDLASDRFSAVIVEPPHAKVQKVLPRIRQGLNFGREGSKFKEQLNSEGVDVIDELFTTKHAAKDFEKGAIKERKENLAFIRGFARGKLARDLSTLALREVQTTVIAGSESYVAESHAVLSAYERANYDFKMRHHPDGLAPSSLRLLEIAGTNHSFADRVGRFATVVAANLVD